MRLMKIIAVLICLYFCFSQPLLAEDYHFPSTSLRDKCVTASRTIRHVLWKATKITTGVALVVLVVGCKVGSAYCENMSAAYANSTYVATTPRYSQPAYTSTSAYVSSPYVATVPAVTQSAYTSTSAYVTSPSIYSKDGKYLGNLNNNRYDPNSVANPYGRYGSQYSSESINNPYGTYGSPYSAESANNPYGSTSSPIVVGSDGTYLGHMNANQYDSQSTSNPYGAYGSPYSSTSINNPYSMYGSR